MGYKRKIKTVILEFTDPEFEGFECEVKSLPISEYLRVAELADQAEEGTKTAKEMFGVFAKALVRWNLEDENDQPVPATYDGVIAQDFDFVMSLIAGWLQSMGGVDEKSTLGKDSPSGMTFPEGSIPMEPLSPSPVS